MKIRFSPNFYSQYKKADVRIQHSTDKKLRIFRKNPSDLELNNHALREPYQDRRSIDITNDYRAHYKEIKQKNQEVIYFISLGTHDELYGKSN